VPSLAATALTAAAHRPHHSTERGRREQREKEKEREWEKRREQRERGIERADSRGRHGGCVDVGSSQDRERERLRVASLERWACGKDDVC
jgi:hypothetical protein